MCVLSEMQHVLEIEEIHDKIRSYSLNNTFSLTFCTMLC